MRLPATDMHLTLPGRVPSKKNSKRWMKFGHRMVLVPSVQFNAWHEEMMLRIRRYRPKQPIPKAKVAIMFFAENRRRFDLSNAAESVMDLLVDAGILEDDSAENVPELVLTYGGVDPRKARAEVAINEQTAAYTS
jgi:Holliday junction resolvase RusA-like endonuclease